MSEVLLNENELARIVVDAAYKVHTKLEPGLLETVYEVVLAQKLRNRKLRVERQVPIPIVTRQFDLKKDFAPT